MNEHKRLENELLKLLSQSKEIPKEITCPTCKMPVKLNLSISSSLNGDEFVSASIICDTCDIQLEMDGIDVSKNLLIHLKDN